MKPEKPKQIILLLHYCAVNGSHWQCWNTVEITEMRVSVGNKPVQDSVAYYILPSFWVWKCSTVKITKYIFYVNVLLYIAIPLCALQVYYLGDGQRIISVSQSILASILALIHAILT